MKFGFHADVECRTCGQLLRRERVRERGNEGKLVFTYLVHEKNDDCPHSEKWYEDPTFGLTEL